VLAFCTRPPSLTPLGAVGLVAKGPRSSSETIPGNRSARQSARLSSADDPSPLQATGVLVPFLDTRRPSGHEPSALGPGRSRAPGAASAPWRPGYRILPTASSYMCAMATGRTSTPWTLTGPGRSPFRGSTPRGQGTQLVARTANWPLEHRRPPLEAAALLRPDDPVVLGRSEGHVTHGHRRGLLPLALVATKQAGPTHH
jgi:hypothetical protein